MRAQGNIRSRIEPFEGGERLVASHDGYLAEYGLIHTRRLEIAADGRSLSGFDQLAGPHGAVRLARDAPYAVRFHLHRKVECTADDDGLLTLLLSDSSRWRFAATGADVSLEPSLHFADPSGTVRSRQIVLRGACWGETEMAWRLEQIS